MNTEALITAIGIPAGSLLISRLAWVGASRARVQANRLEIIKVNADAYDKAQVIYDKAISQLSKQNESLERQVSRFEVRIAQLENVMRESGLTVPPHG